MESSATNKSSGKVLISVLNIWREKKLTYLFIIGYFSDLGSENVSNVTFNKRIWPHLIFCIGMDNTRIKDCLYGVSIEGNCLKCV